MTLKLFSQHSSVHYTKESAVKKSGRQKGMDENLIGAKSVFITVDKIKCKIYGT